MDSLTINTYKYSSGYSYNPSFKGGLKALNELNPISKYTDKFIKKSAEFSRRSFSETLDEFKPYVKIIKLMSDKTTEISALDLNPTGSDKYVFFLHGMSQNVTQYQHLYKGITDRNLGVFAVEYRGYGTNPKSKISEDRFRQDVEVAYRHLTKSMGISPDNIIVMGHSMGGALATNFAYKHPEIKTLILISPVVNVSRIGEKFALNKTLGEAIPPKLKNITEKIQPLNWLYSLRLNALSKMKRNKVPTYIIQSQNDIVTPIESAETLAQVAKKRGILQDMYVLDSGGHIVNKEKINIVSQILNELSES